MTRWMNFTAMSALTLADVPASMRPGAAALAAMAEQAAGTVGVAAAAVALGLYQTLRKTDATCAERRGTRARPSRRPDGDQPALSALRLPPDAGAELSRTTMMRRCAR